MISMKRISFAVLVAFLVPQACAQTYAPGACREVPNSQTCADATPCKELSTGQMACLAGATLPHDALQLTQACWRYTYKYACDGPVPGNSCEPYENNSSCAVVNSVCTDTRPETGNCTGWNYTYQCQTQAATTSSQMVCSANLFNTSAMQAPDNSNNTFGKAALAMEIARETQVYAKGGSTTVFKGEKENCTKGYFGLRNCCNTSSGAQSNRSFLGTLGVSAAYSGVKYAGQQTIDLASPYVFDAMYSSGIFSDGLMSSIASAGSVVASEAGEAIGTNFAANGVSLGAYGFTYGTGTYSAATALPGTMNLSSTFGLGGSGAGGYVSFNPYVFAAVLAIQVIQNITTCTPDEKLLAMHKGANLSVFINQECSSRVLGSCVEYQDNYCSFNSVLASIINVQGKSQLGMDVSNCAGLTVEQVSRIDFKKIDFSKFTDTMVQEAKNGVPGDIKGTYTPIIQTINKGSGQAGNNGLGYPTNATPPPAGGNN